MPVASCLGAMLSHCCLACACSRAHQVRGKPASKAKAKGRKKAKGKEAEPSTTTASTPEACFLFSCFPFNLHMFGALAGWCLSNLTCTPDLRETILKQGPHHPSVPVYVQQLTSSPPDSPLWLCSGISSGSAISIRCLSGYPNLIRTCHMANCVKLDYLGSCFCRHL